MNRYFLHFNYDGTSYCGYQIQPQDPSVQETVEIHLSKIMRKPTPIVGCGRTDTGVHARNYIAHFDAAEPIADLESVTFRLNCMLPADISINHIRPVSADVHARFSALERTYHYQLIQRKSPFHHRFYHEEKRQLDFASMNEAAQHLLEMEDFTSFCKLHSDNKTNICNVTRAFWKEQEPGIWIFEIAADRFLRNMVRAIVGSLIEVGLGNWSVDYFKTVCLAKDRSIAGTSAPAKGLFLVHINYPISTHK